MTEANAVIPDVAKQDLVFVSLEDWDEVWRRNQFICAEMARRSPSRRIVFVGPANDVSNSLRTGRFSRMTRGRSGCDGDFKNIILTRPLKLLPNTIRFGRKVNELMLRRHIRQQLRRLQIKQPILWINSHAAHHLASRLGEAAVVYDITDDWTQLTQSLRQRRLVAKQDAELCKKANAVIVCSRRLFELKRPLANQLYLIANGVDADHYRQHSNIGNPSELAIRWQRPVLGYTGTIHPDRVDVSLVRTIALAWPGSVVLVGPHFLNAANAKMLDLPNVFRVPPVPCSTIPEVMSAFDVCIVPHHMTAFTESLNPIKLWEYLAIGKPIVSTNVAGFRDFPALVRLVRTGEEFVIAATAAVAEIGTDKGQLKGTQRQAVARANSWKCRVDEIECVIRSCAHSKITGANPVGKAVTLDSSGGAEAGDVGQAKTVHLSRPR